MFRRIGLFAVLLVASSALGQDLPPPSPTDLARGLRENGLPDLALEYLGDLAKKASPELQKVLPLERAKCRLEMATTESDDALRDALVDDAKREFLGFVTGNPGHPRLPEAAVALAQLQTIEGKGLLQRSRRLPDDQQAAEAAKARDLFRAATRRYESAANGLKKLLDAESSGSARQKELQREYYQAVLDQGSNLYLLADSITSPNNKEIDEKLKAARQAGEIFDGLAKQAPDHPLGWVARAWRAESYHLLDEHFKAENGLKELIDEANRVRTPASNAGVRMARFFQIQQEFVTNGGQSAPSAGRLKVRSLCRDWLQEFGTSRPNPEVNAIRYYLGTACVNEGLDRKYLAIETVKPADPKGEPTEKIVGVRPGGLTLLREADAQFRILVRTENDYTDRATRQRMRALRWLVGNPDRPPEQFTTFDECYMAALVQTEKQREAAADERKELTKKVIALLERATDLPVPAESVRDQARAELDLARAYYAGGRPHSAAVYAEHLARTARSPDAIARAGMIALAGYQTAADLTALQDQEARAVDRSRMIALASFIESAASTAPATDEVRLQLGVLYSQENRPREMFEVLSRVTPRYAKLAQARLYEGLAAFELVRPAGDDEVPGANALSPQAKQAIFRRAVADLKAVPAPTNDAPEDQVRFYVNMRLQLAQLHITQGLKEYAEAEQVTQSAAAVAASHPRLSDEDKKKLALRCERQLIRAVYGQAMPLFVAGKYAETAERFDPLLKQVLAAGPAVKSGQPAEVADLAKSLDADRISLLLVPTLNARIREGAVAKTTELLDELKKFGGDLSTTARVVQQGVASIRPTVLSLRAEGKEDEAEKLVNAVTAMVNKLASEKDLPNDVRLNLGRSFKDLEEYAKAIELLEAVPSPTDRNALKGELPPVEGETDAERKQREADNAAASLYRLAVLELIRCHRSAGDITKSAALLDDALGAEGELKAGVRPRAGGWGSRFFDFRRESILLIEARAEGAAKPILLWNEAIANWRGWANEYKRTLDRLNQPFSLKKRDAERLSNRLRLIDELAVKDEIDYAAEKVQLAERLAAVEQERDKMITDLAAANAELQKATKETAEAAREKVEELRDTLDDLGRQVSDLRSRPAVLDEFAQAGTVDWAAEAERVQKELAAAQQEMGELERRMNPLKTVWMGLLVDLFRCQMGAYSAVYKTDPAKLSAAVGKHATAIVQFESSNQPLPLNVRQKVYDLLESYPSLKDQYREAGGTDSLHPPAVGL